MAHTLLDFDVAMPNSEPKTILDRLIAEAPKIAPSISNFAESKSYGKVTDEALDTQNFMRWEAEASAILLEMAQYYGGACRELYTEYRKIREQSTNYHSRSILAHKVLELLQSAQQIYISSAAGAKPADAASSSHKVLSPVKRRALILTALGLETTAVLSHLAEVKEAAPVKGTIFYEGIFKDGAAEWEVRVAEAGAGNAPSAVTAERAITGFEPSLALFVGIAGGIKDVDIGDVVVATCVHGYERGRATAERFIARADVGRSSYPLDQRARAVIQAAKWTARIKGEQATTPRGFVGPIAAGEKVVASDKAEIARFIREHYSDALAVEMEGRGFLEALQLNPNVEGIVVRGISDLLSGKKEADASGSQPRAAENAAALAFEMLATHVWPGDARAHAETKASSQPASPGEFERNEDVERLLRRVVPGEMKTSDEVALELLKVTDASGRNELFDALLKYQNCSVEDLFWKALPLIEGCVRLAPWIIGRSQLFEMASHSNFSVRSTAASICMDLAQYAPDRVPVDVLQRLSVYDEDWYVQAPANAALKAIASSIPSVLRIYFMRTPHGRSARAGTCSDKPS